MDNLVINNAFARQIKLHILVSLIISLVFIFILCTFFELHWETNDDVGMSMIAHGYGMASYGSPNIIFSNVIWGYLVRWIPEINGVLGYSTATIVVLITVGFVFVFGIRSLGFGYEAAIPLLVLIMARPVLFPQFTINAGLLMLAALICIKLYERFMNKWLLAAGCLLAYLSYLVRAQEFLLVFIVALPLLPWQLLRLQRSLQVAVCIVALAIIGSAYFDEHAYQGAEWEEFNRLNPVRALITDYSYGIYLKQRPELLSKYGYSTNDIDLIEKWFFVDPKITDPDKLDAMLQELGSMPAYANLMGNIMMGVKTLWHPNLIPIFLTAVFLFMLQPSWRVAGAWILWGGAIVAMGFFGRPGLFRVYIPLASLLLLAPMLTWSSLLMSSRNRFYGLIVLGIFTAAVINTIKVCSDSILVHHDSEVTRQSLREFPTFPVVIWGGVFPYEAVYPVLENSQTAMSYQLYALGVSTLAPFSVAEAENQKSMSLIDRLVQEDGVPIIANEQRFGFLDTYCKEHLNGNLQEIRSQEIGTDQISWRWCQITQ